MERSLRVPAGRGSLGAFGAGAPEPKGLQAVFFFSSLGTLDIF